MRVVIYTQYLKSGGAEKRASVYANYLHLNGVDVHVVTMYRLDNEYYVEPGIPRSYVSDSYDDYRQLSKKNRMLKLREIIKATKPDVIISFLPIFSCYAVLATKYCKELKHIKIIHSVALYQRKYSLTYKIIDSFCCRHADRISLQCYEQLKCNKIREKKCFVCYNPINDKWQHNIERDYKNLSIVSAGRLRKQKNFALTIKAVVMAHNYNPNISLDIYGDGPLKNKLNNLIKKLNAEDYIKLLPFTLNLASEFERYNVFVASSKVEGFPNTLAEAMMSGLVCLSTPCPTGPKEIIDNDNVGILYKNKKQLCENLLRLSRDEERCKLISKCARESAKRRFEDKVVLSKYLEEILKQM